MSGDQNPFLSDSDVRSGNFQAAAQPCTASGMPSRGPSLGSARLETPHFIAPWKCVHLRSGCTQRSAARHSADKGANAGDAGGQRNRRLPVGRSVAEDDCKPMQSKSPEWQAIGVLHCRGKLLLNSYLR